MSNVDFIVHGHIVFRDPGQSKISDLAWKADSKELAYRSTTLQLQATGSAGRHVEPDAVLL